QIIEKLIELDLTTEAKSLQEWMIRHEVEAHEIQEGYNLEIYLWESIMDNLPDVTKVKNADAADKVTGQLLSMLRYIEPTLSWLFKLYEKQPKPSFQRDPMAPKDFNVADYIKELSDDMVTIFTDFQVLYQVIFYKASEDLGASK